MKLTEKIELNRSLNFKNKLIVIDSNCVKISLRESIHQGSLLSNNQCFTKNVVFKEVL